MFSLKSFIEAIQEATLSANDALMQKNMDILNRYFEDDNEDDLQDRIDEFLDATEGVGEQKVSRRRVRESLMSLRETLSANDITEKINAGGDLVPKTVTLNYPTQGKDGKIVNKEVHVPLLTLVPIQFSQIDQLKLNADLELSLVDDELQVSLGKYSGAKKATRNESGDLETAPKSSIGSVEITIKPQEISDGMQHVVDAYEKVLKAQLPL